MFDSTRWHVANIFPPTPAIINGNEFMSTYSLQLVFVKFSVPLSALLDLSQLFKVLAYTCAILIQRQMSYLCFSSNVNKKWDIGGEWITRESCFFSFQCQSYPRSIIILLKRIQSQKLYSLKYIKKIILALIKTRKEGNI